MTDLNVVVTGLGAVTAAGPGAEALSSAASHGSTGDRQCALHAIQLQAVVHRERI